MVGRNHLGNPGYDDKSYNGFRYTYPGRICETRHSLDPVFRAAVGVRLAHARKDRLVGRGRHRLPDDREIRNRPRHIAGGAEGLRIVAWHQGRTDLPGRRRDRDRGGRRRRPTRRHRRGRRRGRRFIRHLDFGRPGAGGGTRRGGCGGACRPGNGIPGPREIRTRRRPPEATTGPCPGPPARRRAPSPRPLA